MYRLIYCEEWPTDDQGEEYTRQELLNLGATLVREVPGGGYYFDVDCRCEDPSECEHLDGDHIAGEGYLGERHQGLAGRFAGEPEA